MTSTNQKINNLESAVSDLQTKSYGVRYEGGSGVQSNITGTISFGVRQHTINIDSSFPNGFRITHAGFYKFGYNLEMYGVPASGGGVAIRRQSGLLYVSGRNDAYSENGTAMAYLNVGDEIYCYVWTSSINVNRGYGRRNFWIHSI